MMVESNFAKEGLNKKKECLLEADKVEVQQFEVIIIINIILEEYYNGCPNRYLWVG